MCEQSTHTRTGTNAHKHCEQRTHTGREVRREGIYIMAARISPVAFRSAFFAGYSSPAVLSQVVPRRSLFAACKSPVVCSQIVRLARSFFAERFEPGTF